MAGKLLGRVEVPTISLDHLTEAQARAFMIADNRLTEISVWDDRLLAQQLKDLSVVDLGFSLEVTGFDMAEIDLRIEGLNEQTEGLEDPADVVPDMINVPVVSLAGDLWLLGDHRVLCGNCLDEASFARLMGDEQAAAAFTDPPYNVRIEGNVSGLGALHHRDFAMASGEMTAAEFTRFLTAACSQLALHSAPGSLHYVAMDWRHLGELLAAGQKAYTELKNVCVWAKNQAGMGSLYRSQHELIFVFKNGRAPA